MEVFEETPIRDAGADVIGMLLKKFLILLTDWFESGADFNIQFLARDAGALGREFVVVANPFIDLLLGGIVIGHQFLIGLFYRIIWIGYRNRHASGLPNQVADRFRLIRTHQRPQQPNQKTTHTRKLTSATPKSTVESTSAGKSCLPTEVADHDGLRIQDFNGSIELRRVLQNRQRDFIRFDRLQRQLLGSGLKRVTID